MVERVGTLLVMAWLAQAAPVDAQAAPTHHVEASLRMEEAAQCIPPGELQSRVETQLGRAVFVANPDVLVTLRAQSDPHGLSLTMSLTSPDGTPLGLRTLRTTGTNCRALDDELALVLALLIDLPEEEIALLIPPEPEPVAAPEPPPEGTSDTLPVGHVEGAVWVGATPSLDLLPGLAVALRAGAELQPLQGFSVEAGLGVTLPTQALQGGAGVSFWAWSFRAGVCAEARVDDLGLAVVARSKWAP